MRLVVANCTVLDWIWSIQPLIYSHFLRIDTDLISQECEWVCPSERTSYNTQLMFEFMDMQFRIALFLNCGDKNRNGREREEVGYVYHHFLQRMIEERASSCSSATLHKQ